MSQSPTIDDTKIKIESDVVEIPGQMIETLLKQEPEVKKEVLKEEEQTLTTKENISWLLPISSTHSTTNHRTIERSNSPLAKSQRLTRSSVVDPMPTLENPSPQRPSSRPNRRSNRIAIEVEDEGEFDSTNVDLNSTSTVGTKNAKKNSTTSKRTKVPSIVTEPEDWKEMWELLEEMRKPGGVASNAPVDSMGCAWLADEDAPPKVQRFQTLISLMLSSQTRDEMNAAAVTALKKLPGGLTPMSLITNPESAIHECIRVVGFHNTKLVNIIAAARTCLEKYDGDIPPTIETLCELRGVGPKMGHLCMQIAWNEVTGIGVDVHVHRITNRFQWHKTKDPEGSRMALEQWLPKNRWESINVLLVGLGQTVCSALAPKCHLCLFAEHGLCPSSSLKTRKKNEK